MTSLLLECNNRIDLWPQHIGFLPRLCRDGEENLKSEGFKPLLTQAPLLFSFVKSSYKSELLTRLFKRKPIAWQWVRRGLSG